MERICLSNADFYRFESEYLGTNMYLAFSENEALIIDPHFDESAEKMLSENSVSRGTVFLTHEHPDHTNGLPWVMEKFKTTLVCQKECAAAIAVEKNNRPYLMNFILAQKDAENGTRLSEKFAAEYRSFTAKADIVFENDFSYDWQGKTFYFKHTPGHSKGSCCISFSKEAVFTGDSLIFKTPVITRFPGGSQKEYETSTLPYLNSLADDTLVLAGHGKVFKMKENR